MEIKKETKNELLKRKEVSFIIESDKNPSFADMKKLTSEKFSKPEENIDVYGIQGKFGRKTFLIKANVYDSPEALAKAIVKTGKQKKEEAKALFEKNKAETEAKKKAAEESKAVA